MLELIKLEGKKGKIIPEMIMWFIGTLIFLIAVNPQKYSDVSGICTYTAIAISMDCFTRVYCKEVRENSLKISMASIYGKKNVLKAKILVSIIKCIPVLLNMVVIMFLVPFSDLNQIIIRVFTELIFTFSVILIMVYSIIKIHPKGFSSWIYFVISLILGEIIFKIESLDIPYIIITMVTVAIGLFTLYLYLKNFNKIAINQELN